jgi:hypothetical protein
VREIRSFCAEVGGYHRSLVRRYFEESIVFHPTKECSMRKTLELGGYLAGLILIIIGVAAISMGISARNEVRSNLAAEKIVGTPDSPIPGKAVNTGERARVFAKVMRKHALEATGDQTYAQMGRFLDADGKPTNDESQAATDPTTHQPVENGARNIWVTETAFTTALNVSYMAEKLALFSIVTGVALLLSGIGFVILTAFSRLHRSEFHIVARKDEPARASAMA